MERFYQYPLGEYFGRTYFLTVSGEPDINDVEEFAVTIHYNNSNVNEEAQIARIDTSHGVRPLRRAVQGRTAQNTA